VATDRVKFDTIGGLARVTLTILMTTDAPGSQFHNATFRTYLFELLTPSKNMSPSIRFAVRLNNTAAELVLHSRRYEEAVEMFTRSLKIVKMQLRKRRMGYHDALIIPSESNIIHPFLPLAALQNILLSRSRSLLLSRRGIRRTLVARHRRQSCQRENPTKLKATCLVSPSSWTRMISTLKMKKIF
jgi:hypothetical protein